MTMKNPPAAPVYPGLQGTGNLSSPSLLLQVLQAYLQPAPAHHTLLLETQAGVTYRELVDWLQEMPRVQEVLGLEHLPHLTTVQKAFAR